MDNIKAADSVAKIRMLNDTFRRNFVGGRVQLTPGIAALDPDLKAQVLDAVRKFEDFGAGNDPYGEHDFVAVKIGDTEVFAKIDYYDRDLRFGSDDPGDASKTERVMTI